MAESLKIEQPRTLDLLDVSDAPGLSSTSDMPVVETKPDAQNEGAPPAAPATQAEEKPAEEADKTHSESATEPGDKPPANDEPKKAQGVQKRLDELVRQREEEKQEKLRILSISEQQQELIKQLQEEKSGRQEAPITPPEDLEPVRPNRAHYDDPNDFETALLDYADQRAVYETRKAIKAIADNQNAESERSAIDEGKRVVHEAYAARVETFKASTPDYIEVAESPNVEIPQLAAMAIVHSKVAPELQYYLGKNPEVAKNLFNLSPPEMLMELGRIGASLTAPAPAPKPTVSAAPRPIAPITPASESVSVDAENESVEAYAARRRREEGWADPRRPTRH